MRVFVTDGGNRAALAVTRSLGRAGHEVIVGEKETPVLAQMSRYCSGRALYPDPVFASSAFVDTVASVVRERRIEVLLPIADITTFLITGNRDRFDASCAVPFARADVIERAADKVEITQVATRLGVPVPQNVVVVDPERIPDDGLEFPLVIKPWRSRVRTPDGWASTSVSYANDREELIRDLSSRRRYEFPLMLQERIEGPGTGVFACYHEGRPVALFSHCRLRERPPWGGVSVLSESVALTSPAREHATRLLSEIGWQGVAMVEFKQDLRDNELKLMEINGRFWGSLQLAIDVGVDFPALLLQTVHSGRPGPQAPYRVGVRNRWLWGDFDSLLKTLFSRGGLPDPHRRRRARAVFEFMRFWGRGLHYDNPKWYDPRPFAFETNQRLWTVVRRLRGGRGTAQQPRAASSTRAAGTASGPIIRTRITSSLDQVGLGQQQWNALAAASGTNSVFQTHQWTRSWLAAFGDLYEPLFVTASDAAGVAGVAPLMVDRRSSRARVLRFLGDGRSDYCDVLAPVGRRGVVAAMFETILADDRWDVVELSNIPAHSDTPDIVREMCQEAGFGFLMEDQFVCPTLLVEGHEEAVRRIFNKPSLRRRQNYFERLGRLVGRNMMAAAEVEPHLEAFFGQHITRWHGSKSASLFVDERNKAFYRTLTAALDNTGWLLFSVIEIDGRPIAFHYGFDYNGAVIWYKPSFDVAFAEHSPGVVMVRHLIGHAMKQKRRELDFTVGDEPFKKRFTNYARKTVQILIYRDASHLMMARSRRAATALLRKMRTVGRPVKA